MGEPSSPTSTRPHRASALVLVLALVALLAAAELTAILAGGDGTFTYSLDDPYIHLALADRIAKGHYGINAGEPAAPASSVLWPLLLVPFARLPGFQLAPLALGLLAAGAAALVHVRVASALASRVAAVVAIATALVLGTNLVGLAFTGMEHALQVALAVAGTWGVCEALERDRRPSVALLAALGAGPLVRYENLALTLPLLGALAAAGHRRAAAAAGAVAVGGLAGFSLFLRSQGLGWLPASVVSKSAPVEAGLAPGSLAANALLNLRVPHAMLLAAALAPLAVTALDRAGRPWRRRVAAALGAAIALHLVFGRFGWYHRYEAYVWSAAAVGMLSLYRERLRGAAARLGPPRTVVAAAVAFLALGGGYLAVPFTTPGAARNVREQTLQVRRFVHEFHRGPVAVNDLGLVALHNPEYVLDVRGLASDEARRLLAERPDFEWLDALTRRRGVDLAIVHEHLYRPRRGAGRRSRGCASADPR